MDRYGRTAFMPVKDTNITEKTSFHDCLDGMADMMKRLLQEMPAANRGQGRYCLNNFSTSLFDPASYETLRQLLHPGRITLHLLLTKFPGCTYDTGLGDYVVARAPSGNAATQWHQDWDMAGHCICVSVLTGDIGDDDAPMLLALEDQVVKCTGRKGMVIIRDVSVWHRGTAHMGVNDRIMPSYRFATADAHRVGYGMSKVLRKRMSEHFPPVIKTFLEKRTRPQTVYPSMSIPQVASLEDDAIAPPAHVAMTNRIIRFVCMCTDLKKQKRKPAEDKKPAEDNKPAEEARWFESRPSSMYSK